MGTTSYPHLRIPSHSPQPPPDPVPLPPLQIADEKLPNAFIVHSTAIVLAVNLAIGHQSQAVDGTTGAGWFGNGGRQAEVSQVEEEAGEPVEWLMVGVLLQRSCLRTLIGNVVKKVLALGRNKNARRYWGSEFARIWDNKKICLLKYRICIWKKTGITSRKVSFRKEERNYSLAMHCDS